MKWQRLRPTFSGVFIRIRRSRKQFWRPPKSFRGTPLIFIILKRGDSKEWIGEINICNRGTADLADKSLSIATVKSLDGMTETEFVAWCDEDVRAEYVDGKVITMSPESVNDERLRWFIGTILQIFVESHDLGEIFGPNLQIRLRPRLRRIPDLLFISQARWFPLTGGAMRTVTCPYARGARGPKTDGPKTDGRVSERIA